MALFLQCRGVSKIFGSRTIFRDLSFAVEEGQRWGLIGPNGAGKSTFLQILGGRIDPDNGECALRKGTRMAYVPQNPVFPSETSVHDIVWEPIAHADIEDADKVARLHRTLGQTGFTDETQLAGTLSGGWRRRLAIAEALVTQPDLLLLDEPTNHLDIAGIEWLESLLASAPFASVTVSHDRYFLENVATNMAEINSAYPEGMLRVEGNYSRFLERREEFQIAQVRRQEALESKVRREVEWLQRGAKARTTKAKARIDEAERLIQELSEVSARNAERSTAAIDFTASDRKTKRLITLRDVRASFGDRLLFQGLKMALLPGVKLGLVGPNGSGKTTLLRILNQELTPDAGEIERAENLQVVRFDQNREQLDQKQSLRRALAPEGDSVMFRGRTIHVAGWAKRFLFRAEQLDLPVSSLSGGEQARVLIARLMLRSADVLLLDEPTNDLDIPTLEVLEESLSDFAGALVLVTHDRYLLDRVSNVVLGLDGEGGATLFADYAQWEQALDERKAQARASKERSAPPPSTASPSTGRKKLSYLEAREWEQMETLILTAEEAVTAAQREMDLAALSGDHVRIDNAYQTLQAAQKRVEELYARWAELEAKQA